MTVAAAAAALIDPEALDQPNTGAAIVPVRAMIGIEGDAASADALSRMGRNLARAGRRPTAKAQKKSLERLRSALEAMRIHDYDKASQRAREALEQDPESGVAWHLMAIALEKGGHFPLAIEAYEAALKSLPNELDICMDLGRLAQRLGGHNIAERLFRLYLAHNPWHIEVTNNLVCLLRDQNRYDEAQDLLQDILSVTPDSAILWNTQGSILSDQGHMAKDALFRRSHAAGPNLPQGPLQSGQCVGRYGAGSRCAGRFGSRDVDGERPLRSGLCVDGQGADASVRGKSWPGLR